MELNDLYLNYIEKWLPEASVKYKDGSQAVNPGLIMAVFFKEGHTPEVRQKMVDSIGTLEGGGAAISLKGACWYTILGNAWLEKLGGEEKLAQRLKNTPEIELLPCNGGLILKAGVLPPGLGETQTEDLPPLLVKINQIIKPFRFNISRSLHFYFEHENFQFDKKSTMKWYRRFDKASAALDKEDEGKSWEPVRITRWSGGKSPFDGRWATIVNETTQYAQTRAGEIMPEFEDKRGQKHHARWSQLERDDGGSVFYIAPDEGN